jgi:hypothetical protein
MSHSPCLCFHPCIECLAVLRHQTIVKPLDLDKRVTANMKGDRRWPGVIRVEVPSVQTRVYGAFLCMLTCLCAHVRGCLVHVQACVGVGGQGCARIWPQECISLLFLVRFTLGRISVRGGAGVGARHDRTYDSHGNMGRLAPARRWLWEFRALAMYLAPFNRACCSLAWKRWSAPNAPRGRAQARA